jgi:hypothetical protein
MSEEPRTLVPVRTQTVDFYGDALAAAEGPDARIYVPLKPIADALGLTWPGQSERTRRHPVLGPAVILLRGLRVGGGNPTVLALPLDLLPGGDHARRLEALEVRLDPKQVLTEEQAAELALAVKTVGQRLASAGDRQGYAKVYSELYRRYRVSSYKNLPQGKFAEVLAWLAGWAE